MRTILLPAEGGRAPRLLADIGPWWSLLRLSAGLVLVGALWIAATNRAGAIAFAVAGWWACGFLALLGVVGATIGPGPISTAKKVLAFASVLGKLLMVALAMGLVGTTYQVVTQQGLALHVLAGLHVFPAVALVRAVVLRSVVRRLDPGLPQHQFAAPKNG